MGLRTSPYWRNRRRLPIGKVMWWFLLLVAQAPPDQASRARARMQASLSAQRESVKRQAESVRAVARKPPSAVSSSYRESSVLFRREQPLCDPLPPAEVARLADSAARKQNLSPTLIQEVARQESGFRPCALSAHGAVGLMQLMPVTQADLGVRNPWDARQSIEAGSRLLRQLLDRYHGDLTLALSAYNAGAGQVDLSGGIPAIPETRNYVDSILFRLPPGVVSPAAFLSDLNEGP